MHTLVIQSLKRNEDSISVMIHILDMNSILLGLKALIVFKSSCDYKIEPMVKMWVQKFNIEETNLKQELEKLHSLCNLERENNGSAQKISNK